MAPPPSPALANRSNPGRGVGFGAPPAAATAKARSPTFGAVSSVGRARHLRSLAHHPRLSHPHPSQPLYSLLQ